MNLLGKMFQSRKYSSAVAVAGVTLANDVFKLGISQETIYIVAGIVATWIAGESYVDGKREE